MRYENAPATAILATNCGICGKELLDAVSTECGVGPRCRKLHGYDVSQGPPDWSAASKALFSSVTGILPAPCGHEDCSEVVGMYEACVATGSTTFEKAWGTPDGARVIANRLARQVALEPGSQVALACVQAISALGFRKVAMAMATHRGSPLKAWFGDDIIVVVQLDDVRFSVKSRYNANFVVAVNEMGSQLRSWDDEHKVWVFRSEAKRAVWAALKASYPAGTLLVSEKGVVVL